MWQPEAEHVRPLGPENADADHSAKVRSMCPPAGESMSWHEPHIVALSFCWSSWKDEYVDAWALLATGSLISPRITRSPERLTDALSWLLPPRAIGGAEKEGAALDEG